MTASRRRLATRLRGVVAVAVAIWVLGLTLTELGAVSLNPSRTRHLVIRSSAPLLRETQGPEVIHSSAVRRRVGRSSVLRQRGH